MREHPWAVAQQMTRRHILGTAGLAALAGTPESAGKRVVVPPRATYRTRADEPSVSLIKGNDRRENVYKSLKLIEDHIFGAIRDRQILIKPNFVQTSRQLAASHVAAIRGILEFLRTRHKKVILIGESTANKEGTFAGYKNYGYTALEKEYKVRLLDLNLGAYEYRYVIDEKNQPFPIRICQPFVDPKYYVISAAVMKTHGFVVVTLSLKNILLGAPINDYKKSDKGLMHKGPHGSWNDLCHFNMFHLAQDVYPDLAVIDGFEGMEGDGPSRGTPVDSRLALASADPLAADTLGAKVMGFDPKKILYLSAMAEAGFGQGDLAKIRILGDSLEDCQQRYKPTPLLNYTAI